MSGPIQVIPKGLLGLLQLKQQGNNPSELSNVVASCFDIRELYYQQLVQDQFSLVGGLPTENVNPAANGNHAFTTSPLLVPAGFMWLVLQYSIVCNLLAAETIKASCQLITDPALSTPVLLGDSYTDVVTARARTANWRASGPFYAPAGSSIGFVVHDVLTAATISCFGNIRAVAIPI